MFKYILGLAVFSLTASAAPGKLQNADFATAAQITGAGGSVNQLLNTSKVYDDVNGQLLDTTLAALVTPSVGVLSVTGSSPVQSTGGVNPVISMPVASSVVDGYLSSVDWSTFNAKGSGTVTSVTGSAPVQSTGGPTPAISMPVASTSVDGYLSAANFTIFNNKGSGTVTSVTASAPITSTGGPTPLLAMPAATAAVDGYLTAANFSTFNGKQSAGNYVTSVTGDISIVGPGAVTGTLVTVNGSPGTFGTSTSIPVVTVNNKGLVTSVTTVAANGSPLTTKGDVYVYGSADARLPVGSNGQIITADSTKSTGLNWITSALVPARSQVRMDTYNGYGSTGTARPRFTNTVTSGTGITCTTNSTVGNYCTINTAGLFTVDANCGAAIAADSYVGIVFQTTLGAYDNGSTIVDMVPVNTNLYGYSSSINSGQLGSAFTSWTGFLDVNNVIDLRTRGAVPATAGFCSLTITQVSF